MGIQKSNFENQTEYCISTNQIMDIQKSNFENQAEYCISTNQIMDIQKSNFRNPYYGIDSKSLKEHFIHLIISICILARI